MFKNEERALKEWLQLYLYHGADHLYLIDDGSDDRSVSVLDPFIAKGVVTLFQEKNHPYYLARQHTLYNRYVLPHIEEAHWLLMVDLDEFMWSPRSINLCEVLAELDHVGQIQMS